MSASQTGYSVWIEGDELTPDEKTEAIRLFRISLEKRLGSVEKVVEMMRDPEPPLEWGYATLDAHVEAVGIVRFAGSSSVFHVGELAPTTIEWLEAKPPD